MPVEPVTLAGRAMRLEPLAPAHHTELIAAVQDGELWRHWYTTAPEPQNMTAEIERRLGLLAEGSMLPFTIFGGAQGHAVGMTSFMAIDRKHFRVEIGSTWIARSVQRTALNTEAKLVLLTHAFETLGCVAVELRTHALNFQSRSAIERLGAKLDGILRNHQRARNGTLRDTCVYSIIQSEWPTIRAHLEWQLAMPRT
ncbi:GNAT family N-acetyltransferase [Rhodoblastus acidophilus]|uniref:GNAT family N-acetyltransferase n=2 Tax=Candidatus Rhodoblastus alkanivorans TaxID=2954117 RepID=A0ABS9Z3V4_9HYPH|nr:GNAT family protein [Candidatus Rhodoblastus alkanivorans]MCI4679009.1 GNAT family N-acetyltransferase [Candidatus Rhodoblastus alkanivorans]MCI4681736.1 GNAT family N-acetyltransferase [Candidatus Rhodoblastus alkanivorans]MDI4642785.1 GNAT family N-acetyltransferase [Rhodoblastus acidophilus]